MYIFSNFKSKLYQFAKNKLVVLQVQ